VRICYKNDCEQGRLMKTSIIICFYERLEYLKCCLQSLDNCRQDFNEVIIADDGSDAGVIREIKKIISRSNFPIIHAWHTRNGARRAATRNNGIRYASGDYLIFLDADLVALPGAIKSHVTAAKENRFVAGRCKYATEEQTELILNASAPDELLEKTYQELPDDTIIKEHREFIRYGILRKLRLVSPRKPTFGGHFSAFKEDIESVNGYDENYVGWGGEDQDMALRLVMAGLSGISAIPSARILHLWHPREIGDKHWREGENVEYFFRKKISAYCENGLIKGRKVNNLFKFS